MPLLLGLKQLPAGAQSLLGWQVLCCGTNEEVGTVVQVRLTVELLVKAWMKSKATSAAVAAAAV
jgi:hypothetical protein